MHVQAVLDAIKKRGHFEDYEKAAWRFKEAEEAIMSARAGLSLLEDNVKKAAKEKKKKLKEKARESEKTQDEGGVTPKAPAKAPEPEPKTPEETTESMAAVQEAEDATRTDDQMKANFLSDLEKAKKVHCIAKGAMAAAAAKMFAFYSNLLSPESK